MLVKHAFVLIMLLTLVMKRSTNSSFMSFQVNYLNIMAQWAQITSAKYIQIRNIKNFEIYSLILGNMEK